MKEFEEVERLGAVLSWDEKERKPVALEDCWGCGACLLVCPMIRKVDESRIEWISESIKDPLLGYLSKVYIGRTKENFTHLPMQEEIAKEVVARALENGMIDGAILTRRDENDPLNFHSVIVKSPEELDGLTSCSGPSSIFVAFEEAVNREGLHSLAIVGTPCQVTAGRNIQLSGLGKMSRAIKLLIGVWCNTCVNAPLVRLWAKEGKVSPSEVTDLYLDGGKLVATLKTYGKISMWNEYCSDYVAEYADLSIGATEVKDGWAIILPRTDIGLRAIKLAADAGAVKLMEVDGEEYLRHAKLISKKKKESSKSIEPLAPYERTNFETLSKKVLRINACSQCGACYAVCPKMFPWIVPTWCEGCGDCVKACEFDARELVKRMKYRSETECAWVTHPERCTGCGECASACTWGATRMTKYINMAKWMYRDPAKHP
ncbi:4Fe-4S dicluster domain-containing protein [Candidatus Bathyarchaeota archaeon]|nr:4Fe-4S dicluster domain-containing protein [Candidatus Bathyarchaeota archaeon]